MDMWASLPPDLLLVILLNLELTTVICCAGVCKLWRRAIISNASVLGPHLDRFGPSLVLGVFHNCRDAASLRRTPGPFQSALPWKNDDGDNNETAAAADSLIPISSAASSDDRGSYKELLCSRDGFMLLMARSSRRGRSLCLCNPMTGDCTFLPSAARGRYSTYFLLTGYDDLLPSARVLAVHTRTEYNHLESVFMFKERVLSYQIFSTSGDNAGKWGPVRRSVGELQEGLCVWMHYGWTTAVSGDAVYFLAGPGGYITCVLALDAGIGRTWITELPKRCHFSIDQDSVLAILATSSDGRLSYMQSFDYWYPKIHVWVLTGDGDAGWTLTQTIPIWSPSLIASGHPVPHLAWFSAFCPRSGCMVVTDLDKEFLIDLRSGSSYPPVTCIGDYDGYRHICPYEIDCSRTYISQMKHF